VVLVLLAIHDVFTLSPPSTSVSISVGFVSGFGLTYLIFYIEAAVAVWPIAVVRRRAWCCLTTPHIQINLLEGMTMTTMIISLDKSKGDAGSGLLPVELWRRGGEERNRARGRWMSTSSSEE
jgi:hypothetical protein